MLRISSPSRSTCLFPAERSRAVRRWSTQFRRKISPWARQKWEHQSLSPEKVTLGGRKFKQHLFGQRRSAAPFTRRPSAFLPPASGPRPPVANETAAASGGSAYRETWGSRDADLVPDAIGQPTLEGPKSMSSPELSPRELPSRALLEDQPRPSLCRRQARKLLKYVEATPAPPGLTAFPHAKDGNRGSQPIRSTRQTCQRRTRARRGAPARRTASSFQLGR
jgi:hypothetical protein